MARGNKEKKKGSWIQRILVVLALSMIVTGLYLLITPWWIRYNQDKITDQLLDQLDLQPDPAKDDPEEKEPIIWVDPDAWVNSDEEIDYFIPDPDIPGKYIEISPPPSDPIDHGEAPTVVVPNPDEETPIETVVDNSPTPVVTDPVTTPTTTHDGREITNSQGQVGLVPMAKLVMPSINVNIPIITGLTRVHLRYAAAHYEVTPMPGDLGMSAIFAHRSPQHGRDLNRLNEMKVGDRFQIVQDGKTLNYITEVNVVIKPNEVFDYIFGNYNHDSYLMLVTCHPIPTWEDRLIVVARLESITE